MKETVRTEPGDPQGLDMVIDLSIGDHVWVSVSLVSVLLQVSLDDRFYEIVVPGVFSVKISCHRDDEDLSLKKVYPVALTLLGGVYISNAKL